VPAFSLVLLWLRGDRVKDIRWEYDRRGLALLAGAFLLRCANLMTRNVDWVDGLAFVVAIGGICGLIGGVKALGWAWPAVAFLMFMLPLPYTVERLLGSELRALATQASTSVLQLMGLPAVAEGNVILLNDQRLGVAEACSGLSMLLIFAALAVAFAAVVRRPLLDRAILVASAAPIAVAANVVRITATGALAVWVSPRAADLVFHDLAGWLMMPMALALLWIELRFLSYVLIDDAARAPMATTSGSGVCPPGALLPVAPAGW
jgi:exosortase